MRTILAKTLGALAIIAIAAFGADNLLGTWKLNVEKSKYTPAPMPVKSEALTAEPSNGGVKMTETGEAADGIAFNGTFALKYDGKDVHVTGNVPYDTASVKQVNANKFTYQLKQTNGPFRDEGSIVISKDGKTMTMTAKGTDSEGKAYTSTDVYDKQ